MTTTTCPTCGKVVDSLRARSVGVRDGKVVAYCSAVCAQAAESRPVSVKIRTPAAGVAVVIPTSPESGPIIEIIREGSVPTEVAPAASGGGKVGKAARRDATPVPKAAVEAKRKAVLEAAADADDDDEINGDDAPPPARKLPVMWIVIAVLVLGGGVALAVKMLSHGGTAHARLERQNTPDASDSIAPARAGITSGTPPRSRPWRNDSALPNGGAASSS